MHTTVRSRGDSHGEMQGGVMKVASAVAEVGKGGACCGVIGKKQAQEK